jgi:hypothetical protein
MRECRRREGAVKALELYVRLPVLIEMAEAAASGEGLADDPLPERIRRCSGGAGCSTWDRHDRY